MTSLLLKIGLIWSITSILSFEKSESWINKQKDPVKRRKLLMYMTTVLDKDTSKSAESLEIGGL